MSLSENSRAAGSRRCQASPESRAPLGSDCRLSSNSSRRKNAMDVKVCLFGPVDHDQTQKFLLEEAAKMEEIESRRWNFDFAQECPLPGTWEWEAIHESQAPSFYSSVCGSWETVATPADSRQSGVDFLNFKSRLFSRIASNLTECATQEDKENIKSSPKDCGDPARCPKFSPEGHDVSPKRKLTRPSVLDFYQSKKRRSPSNSKHHNGTVSEEEVSLVEERSSSSQ